MFAFMLVKESLQLFQELKELDAQRSETVIHLVTLLSLALENFRLVVELENKTFLPAEPINQAHEPTSFTLVGWVGG